MLYGTPTSENIHIHSHSHPVTTSASQAPFEELLRDFEFFLYTAGLLYFHCSTLLYKRSGFESEDTTLRHLEKFKNNIGEIFNGKGLLLFCTNTEKCNLNGSYPSISLDSIDPTLQVHVTIALALSSLTNEELSTYSSAVRRAWLDASSGKGLFFDRNLESAVLQAATASCRKTPLAVSLNNPTTINEAKDELAFITRGSRQLPGFGFIKHQTSGLASIAA